MIKLKVTRHQAGHIIAGLDNLIERRALDVANGSISSIGSLRQLRFLREKVVKYYNPPAKTGILNSKS